MAQREWGFLPEGTLAAVDEACGREGRAGFVLAAVTRALEPGAARGPMKGSGRLAGGVACHGAACAHGGCFARDTARYGDPSDHGGLVLCTAHAAAAVGVKYQRPGVPLPAKG